MNNTVRFIIPLLLFLFGANVTHAQFLTGPHPGDIFKEFTRYNATNNRDAYVTDPNTSNAQAQQDLPNDVLSLNVNDLAGAIRAELVIDHWAGHTGTTNRQFRFNNHSWITIPELNATSGIPSGHSGQCYNAQYNPTVPIPLNNLVQGNNTLQGTSGGQTCYNFGWGTWGWYGVILRVYYGSSKPHPTGSITSPAANSTVGENPTVSASASGDAVQAQFLAYYDGIDYDGDGVHQEYHHSWHRGKSETSMNMKNHVGTDVSAPFSATWNTDLVPEQAPGSVKFIARLKNNSGVYFITNEVTGVSLQRTGSTVRLYRANDMPERFWVRSGRSSKSTHMNIPSTHNLGTATSAKLVVATWNGNDVSEAGSSSMKINSLTLPDFGQDHYYSFDILTFAKSNLFNGNNTFTASATTTQHGIEVLWPGPALVVRYSGSAGPTAPSITQQPQNQSAAVGQTATFSVAASGTTPLAYQWQKNNTDISGATSASYTTPPVLITDNGATFRCRVTNAYGNVTSNNATLTVTVVGGGGANVLANPGFEAGTGSWTFYTSGAGSFTTVTPGAQGLRAAKIDITTQGTNVQLYQSNVPLQANTAYKLTFTAYSNTSHDLSVSLLKQVSPYSSYGLDNFVANLTGGWQTFTRQFTTAGFSGTVNDGRLRFWFAPYDAAGDDYFIDNVILQTVGSEPDMPGISKAPDQPVVEQIPTEFGLQQNYPNPFNPSTTIRYELPEAAYVTLKVYDVIGREVATLVDGQQAAGQFDVVLNGQNLASGIYFYRIKAGNFTAMKRLVLMK